MTPAIAAVMMIVWPGHDIAPQGYTSLTACETARSQLLRAGHDLVQDIPGFRAWCVSDDQVTS